MRNRIRVLRAERKWSQAELADRLGVTRQTVNAVENDKYDPTLSLAFRIGRVFGISIDQVFQDDEPSASTPARQDVASRGGA